MTNRLTALAAALLLAVTLAACGEADKKADDAPDTTPNGSITTQPDTNGSDQDIIPGDSMNGGHNADGGAVPGDGAYAPDDTDGITDGTGGLADEARTARRYDRALAASLSQLILNRLPE